MTPVTAVTNRPTLTTMRSTLANRRAVREQEAQLLRELASYDTPAQRLDLMAMLERHTDEELASIAPVLDSPAMARSLRRAS